MARALCRSVDAGAGPARSHLSRTGAHGPFRQPPLIARARPAPDVGAPDIRTQNADRAGRSPDAAARRPMRNTRSVLGGTR
ncbi:hypothetical protein [Methylobacterium sp. A54F]